MLHYIIGWWCVEIDQVVTQELIKELDQHLRLLHPPASNAGGAEQDSV
jgi:hypothetical protein